MKRKNSDAMHLGDYRVEIVPDTEFRLDGGAMFGVVPRKLWAKECPPDDENRIRMNMNCVFIDTGAEKILIRPASAISGRRNNCRCTASTARVR